MFCISIAANSTTAPIGPRIHAHNDYLHPHPLFDALDAGARSVEADIFLVNGKLLVAHNWMDVREDRSLQSLYLDPLCKRISEHNGSVYGDGETLFLLIDIKSDGEATYRVLKEMLKEYDHLLTHFSTGKSGAVSVVLTGEQPARTTLQQESDRIVASD